MDLNRLKKLRKVKINKKLEQAFIRNLYKIGYCRISGYNSEKSNKILTTAFQRKYRNQLIDGKIDYECFLISKNILKAK